MQRQTDPYIRDRLHDLDDLANRLLRILTGDGGRSGTRSCRKTPSSSRATWAGRTARVRPHAPAWAGAGGGSGDQPRRDHRQVARAGGGGAGQGHRLDERGRRRHHRRRQRRQGASAAHGRGGAGLCRQGEALGQAAGALRRDASTSRRSAATASKSRCCTIPGWSPTCRCSTTPAPRGWGCSAPSCSS